VDVPHTLPSLLTSFVGRESEQAELNRLLDLSRLVTVAGPGGIGKTRLALEVARGHAVQGRTVLFSDLGRAGEEGLALHALGNALGIHEASAESLVEAVCARLAGARVLVLLDNAEIVAGEARGLAESLLRGCPEVRLLVTSRVPLGAPGEHVWRLPPLRLPPEFGTGGDWRSSDAVELFARRVEAARAGYEWHDTRRAAAVVICRRLDGVPLALEVAAARAGSLAVEDLGRELDSGLALLDSTAPAELRRHDTLQATLEWSYRMLSGPDQALLRRLSAFSGGATLAAAEAVCRPDESSGQTDTIAAGLARLVGNSMVVVQEAAGSPARYALLEPLRDFALERLAESGERDAVARCHRSYFVRLVEDAARRLRGPGQVAAMRELDAEDANVRTALSVCLASGEVAHAARLVAGMDLYWDIRARYRESLRWCDLVLAAMEADDPWRGRVLRVAGRTRSALGEHDEAVDLLSRSVEAARDRGSSDELGESLCWLGMAFERQRDASSALRCAEEAEALVQDTDPWLQALRLRVLAHGEKVRSGDLICVEAIHKREYELCQRAGDSLFTGNVLNCLGEFARWRGDYTRAEMIYKESLARRQAVGDLGGTVLTMVNLGLLATQTGHEALALDYLSEALELSVRIGSPLQFGGVTLGLAAVAANLDRADAAARLLGVTRSLTRGAYLDPQDAAVRDAAEDRSRAALGDERFAAFEASGALVSLQAAIEESREFVRGQLPAFAPAAVPYHRPAPFGLSPREVEVLRMLASGLTNRDIAAKLVLSTRTVETHVANAYAKLEVANRAEATARVLQMGLAAETPVT